MKNKIQKGFTLLELLVVIGIIGILLSLITVSFSNAQKQSRDTRRRQDVVAIQNALEQYYSQNSFVYPVGSGCANGGQVSACTLIQSYFTGNTIPTDPLSPSATYKYYFSSLSASNYTVTATLEKGGTIIVSNLQ